MAYSSFFLSLIILSVSVHGKNLAGIPCGKQFDRIPKIIGGIPTFQHEFPWVISIKLNGLHACGGSLIHSKYVLTAAQCLFLSKNVSIQDMEVTVGEHFLNKAEAPEDSISYKIETVFTHPEYQGSTHENDIALIRLKKNVFISPAAWPACLSEEMNHRNIEGSLATVAGWGTIAERNLSNPGAFQLSESLQKTKIPIWNNQECRESFKMKGYSFPLLETQLCAGSFHGGMDTCNGDSGSPLIIKSRKSSGGSNLEIVGITIGGLGCGRPGLPGVYTRVAEYLPWIEKQMNETESFNSIYN